MWTILVFTFAHKPKYWTNLLFWLDDRDRSPNWWQFFLRGTLICSQSFTAIHPIVFNIFAWTKVVNWLDIALLRDMPLVEYVGKIMFNCYLPAVYYILYSFHFELNFLFHLLFVKDIYHHTDDTVELILGKQIQNQFGFQWMEVR